MVKYPFVKEIKKYAPTGDKQLHHFLILLSTISFKAFLEPLWFIWLDFKAFYDPGSL